WSPRRATPHQARQSAAATPRKECVERWPRNDGVYPTRSNRHLSIGKFQSAPRGITRSDCLTTGSGGEPKTDGQVAQTPLGTAAEPHRVRASLELYANSRSHPGPTALNRGSLYLLSRGRRR